MSRGCAARGATSAKTKEHPPALGGAGAHHSLGFLAHEATMDEQSDRACLLTDGLVRVKVTRAATSVGLAFHPRLRVALGRVGRERELLRAINLDDLAAQLHGV